MQSSVSQKRFRLQTLYISDVKCDSHGMLSESKPQNLTYKTLKNEGY
jgi:hypothetical protein